MLIVTFILAFFLFNNSIKDTVSQPISAHCPLEFKNLTTPQNSTCEEGTWNNFLKDKCCKEPFSLYLDALALHANQTGNIYLNSTEQASCLNKMKDNITDVFTCGIDKLTRGVNGCSGFSVSDVVKELGDDVVGLSKGCGLLVHYGSDDYWNLSCGNCVKSWLVIKGIEPGGGDADLCRFAVLTALAGSRVDDYSWMHNIHKCLGEQVFNTGDERKSHMIGLLSGISALVVLCVYIMARRLHGLHGTSEEDGMKRDLPTKTLYLKVPVREIYVATNNLDELNYIGEGTAGKVYKGILSNKTHVAIKHIIDDGFIDTFLREVKNLALVRHPNLVPLLGYCDNGDECFLIYELCTNGNLSEWLLGRKNGVLSWIQRLEIAVDCARGLWFLHTYPEGCIVHRDIKPTNILLGPNCEAKLSDFGLSKVIDIGATYASSEVRGTFGYVDPEYQTDRQVNSASDVYSFGIVLLQILSGRRVINMNASKPMPLDRMAKLVTKGGSIIGFADPKLEGEYSTEAFELVFKLALSCTGHKQERPSMEQVVERLEVAHEISLSVMAPYLHKTREWSLTEHSRPD
ncbi:probable LRR receptor-like serine/threonine-protein kinase [Tanacetum coccineum]